MVTDWNKAEWGASGWIGKVKDRVCKWIKPSQWLDDVEPIDVLGVLTLLVMLSLLIF